ncbi:hypothetical protein [Nocardia rosealba]|uniref:hypothetical protein n=1 Tax=Nocardia rosealba TaxID=2878563 RepID=UPI001CD9897D|nr:hypothetical protein [Nocardia rosealba]MCA2208654.1 hypothetical protein [Nocardia rosealba]
MRKVLAASALLATAICVSAGTASPVPGNQSTVNYTLSATDRYTLISTDAGSITADDGVLAIKAANGAVLGGTELSFRVDDFVFPIAAEVKDRTATLTPQFDVAHAVYRPVALPYENQAPWKSEYEREQAAWSRLTSTIALGASVGTTVGGLGGAAIGCVLGGIAGATVASATIIGLFGAFIPAAAVGCIGGIVAIGALGTVLGQLFVTAPVAIMAAVQYFTTINAPAPVPTK